MSCFGCIVMSLCRVGQAGRVRDEATDLRAGTGLLESSLQNLMTIILGKI